MGIVENVANAWNKLAKKEKFPLASKALKEYPNISGQPLSEEDRAILAASQDLIDTSIACSNQEKDNYLGGIVFLNMAVYAGHRFACFHTGYNNTYSQMASHLASGEEKCANENINEIMRVAFIAYFIVCSKVSPNGPSLNDDGESLEVVDESIREY